MSYGVRKVRCPRWRRRLPVADGNVATDAGPEDWNHEPPPFVPNRLENITSNDHELKINALAELAWEPSMSATDADSLLLRGSNI
jgi:mannose-6-phosphate isomerase-like protein (cupin superfamily)